ncbi:BRF1-domain-containing protein [Karstenula rhodostoma CBS 690.94]|uniref:BRF1-domain-containing protein n=1 Tax=Karstenula rhodostoma CBS 690.94 TaxID=1392251 RepID=A0A9P4PKS3_9PLEO|nr:BRF1-domain-containing protein [Karstenula rhodostoma CBS 690.94]
MPGPVVPARRQPRVRLSNFQQQSKPSPTPPPVQPAQRPKHTCCESPEIGEDDGRTVCFNCATVHDESNIVSEITFGETSGGRAMVHGGTVGNDQRHANSMGGQASGINGGDSGQTTADRGKSAINSICSKINVPSDGVIAINAKKWYQLALNHSFVQGRGIFKVAAAAIYLASRRHKGSTVLLMDLAESIQVNVWNLGTVYRTFCQVLMADDSSGINGNNVLEIEPLMLKFCQRLEFDQDSHRVAADACLILKRMSRDWMVQGRNPAGLCGACIIIAARMNNFRRTVREVVYVVKVADTTINQRLYEYRRTQSAQLSVKQFREYAPLLKTKIAPPAVYLRQEREEREEARKRKASELENGESVNFDELDNAEEDVPEGATPPVPSKPTKRQAEMLKKRKSNSGEALPTPAQTQDSDQANGEGAEDIVVDVDALTAMAGDDIDAGLDALANAEDATAADEEAIVVPKKRGRPRKTRAPVIIPEEDLEVEQELEEEMLEAMSKWEDIFMEFKENENHVTFIDSLDKARKLVELYKPDRNVNSEEEIGEDEFQGDPDVDFCELSYEESQAKERIWLIENEDWLRQQQEKILLKALEEARGNPKKPKQKRRKQQMGDGSILDGQPAASADEAAKKMLQKRAKHFSSHINYDVFKDLMPTASDASSGTATPAEQAATPATEQPTQPTYQVVPVGEGDDEAEEEEDQQQFSDEEDPNQEYMEDDAEGFDPEDDYEF